MVDVRVRVPRRELTGLHPLPELCELGDSGDALGRLGVVRADMVMGLLLLLVGS